MAKEPGRHWRLVDVATGATVVGRLRAAFDSASRRTGLLGRDAWPDGEGLVIAPCQFVHTVAMRFPIDVLCVRRDGTIEKLTTRVPPWRIAGAWRAFAVIETAASALGARRPGLAPGDRVTVEPGD